jgi:hypothetical protein
MPPRFTYWTIILEGKPTAFRAHTRDELLPTLKQLQARHPDAVLLWFARGRLWESPDQARAALLARRAERDRRGADWRPGGAHRDPRDRYKIPRDEKRRRFSQRLRRDRSEQEGSPSPKGRSPEGDRPRGPRWNPKRPQDNRLRSGSGEGGPWKPGRPRGPAGGEKRAWGPPRGRGRPQQSGRGGRKPGGGGGGRKGGGGGGPSR